MKDGKGHGSPRWAVMKDGKGHGSPRWAVMMTNPFLEAALGYAAHGWAVFPTAEMRKVPPLVKWSKESAVDPDKIKWWWGPNKWPRANIGLDCSKSGVIVVDLDVAAAHKARADGEAGWLDLEIEYGLAPTPVRARTISGGRHLFYAGDDVKSSSGKIAPGVDTRGLGGLVVLSPSCTAAGAYRWASRDCWRLALPRRPEWLADLLRAKAPSDKTDQTPAPGANIDSDANVAWASHYLAHEAPPANAGECGNPMTLFVAGRLKDGGISRATAQELMAEIYNDRCEPPWSLDPDCNVEDSLAKIIDNAYDYLTENAPGSSTPEVEFAEDMIALADGEEPPPRIRKQKPKWIPEYLKTGRTVVIDGVRMPVMRRTVK
jgi:hypothetical protein